MIAVPQTETAVKVDEPPAVFSAATPLPEPEPKPLTLVEKIQAVFPDAPIMLEVARCESGIRHYDQVGNVLKSRLGTADYGVFQINAYYHEETARSMGLDIYSVDDNITYARFLYDTYGLQPWSASAPCWS